jgi:hypothetical protein
MRGTDMNENERLEDLYARFYQDYIDECMELENAD